MSTHFGGSPANQSIRRSATVTSSIVVLLASGESVHVVGTDDLNGTPGPRDRLVRGNRCSFQAERRRINARVRDSRLEVRCTSIDVAKPREVRCRRFRLDPSQQEARTNDKSPTSPTLRPSHSLSV